MQLCRRISVVGGETHHQVFTEACRNLAALLHICILSELSSAFFLFFFFKIKRSWFTNPKKIVHKTKQHNRGMQADDIAVIYPTPADMEADAWKADLGRVAMLPTAAAAAMHKQLCKGGLVVAKAKMVDGDQLAQMVELAAQVGPHYAQAIRDKYAGARTWAKLVAYCHNLDVPRIERQLAKYKATMQPYADQGVRDEESGVLMTDLTLPASLCPSMCESRIAEAEALAAQAIAIAHAEREGAPTAPFENGRGRSQTR
jgi:hypothetical protein